MTNVNADFLWTTGRLVSVRGNVVKVSCVRPMVDQMDFSCAKCGALIRRIFPDGKYSPPLSCTFYSCKGRTFTPVRSTARLIDFQKIRHVVTQMNSYIGVIVIIVVLTLLSFYSVQTAGNIKIWKSWRRPCSSYCGMRANRRPCRFMHTWWHRDCYGDY